MSSEPIVLFLQIVFDLLVFTPGYQTRLDEAYEKLKEVNSEN